VISRMDASVNGPHIARTASNPVGANFGGLILEPLGLRS
jgi:hypothetical protein